MAEGRLGDRFFGRRVIGIDEAGRGPLAGPVVAAGVLLDTNKPIVGLNDSKKLPEHKREHLYAEIMERALFVTVFEIDAATIDRVNILEATFLAMRQVILSCLDRGPADVILIDGNRTVPGITTVKQIAVVKGDTEIDCIMAASIVAKVHRDRLMRIYDNEFPGYGFAAHKGYGTRSHLDALYRLGPCALHRMSFSPLREAQ